MPWMETCPVKERMRFVVAIESGLYSMTEACQRYGVSRKTGYKWWNRYQEQNLKGLEDRSRIIMSCGGGMPQDVTTENINAFLSEVESL